MGICTINNSFICRFESIHPGTYYDTSKYISVRFQGFLRLVTFISCSWKVSAFEMTHLVGYATNKKRIGQPEQIIAYS